MSIINTFPTTIANGQVADATVVMSLFSWVQSQTNGNACPATTGTGILKGNGSGGTNTASPGTDYVTGAQGQGLINYLTSVAGKDTITASVSVGSLAAYAAGQTYRFVSAGANTTTSVTLNIDGIGAVSVTKNGATALAVGDIPSGAVITVFYDGTQFQLIGVANNATTAIGPAGAFNWTSPVTLASAATVNIGAAASNVVIISGTTTITAFDTVAAGAERWVRFSGALTLTYNATSLILPGLANITTAANDEAVFVSLGSGNWKCISYTKASGLLLTQGNSITASNQTAMQYTGLPSTINRIVLEFNNISTNGTSFVIVQLGTGGTPTWTTTGYTSASALLGTSTVSGVSTTAGFLLDASAVATAQRYGLMILQNLPGTNYWGVLEGGSRSDTGAATSGGGGILLGATLTAIRLTTVNGTDTFDTGTINITYE